MTTEPWNADNLELPRPGQSEIALIRDLFCRVNDAYGLMAPQGGIQTVRGSLTDELIQAHVEGRIRLGALFVDPEGMADQLAIDIDEHNPDLALNTHRVFTDLRIDAYIAR